MQLKNSHLARDPQAAKAYAEQALALDQELNSIAKRALQQADFQRDIASNYQERVPSIAEYGGFQGLKIKLEQEQLAKQDVVSLLRHMQHRVQEKSYSRSQDRGRTH